MVDRLTLGVLNSIERQLLSLKPAFKFKKSVFVGNLRNFGLKCRGGLSIVDGHVYVGVAPTPLETMLIGFKDSRIQNVSLVLHQITRNK